MKNIIPASWLLSGFSIFELILALWLIGGWKIRWSAAVSGLLLIGITAFNTAVFDVVFRDIGLAFAAAALFVLAE